jgi:hypothetical protein
MSAAPYPTELWEAVLWNASHEPETGACLLNRRLDEQDEHDDRSQAEAERDERGGEP